MNDWRFRIAIHARKNERERERERDLWELGSGCRKRGEEEALQDQLKKERKTLAFTPL